MEHLQRIKYNNADHSMLTAMVSVDNICDGVLTKGNLWSINTEQEYHEEKKESESQFLNQIDQVQPKWTSNIQQTPFREFLLKDRVNKKLLFLSALVMVTQWLIFKYIFPFANYIYGDSFGYIQAAARNADINTHMIGYSRFLRLFSVFSNSDTILVTLQYIISQLSGLFLLFTLCYFIPIKRISKVILWCILVPSPLFLYISNLVSSDCLFMDLSLVWFSLLLWLIYKPSNQLFIAHAVVLCLAFTFRYNALVYPAISLLAFLISKQITLLRKIIAFGIPLTLCGLFIFYTGNKYKVLTGKWQYAPFSGWQAANNAMYTYRYVNKQERIKVPVEYEPLDKMIREYFDSTRDVVKFPQETIKASTVYMWTPNLPLYQYREKALKDSTSSELKKWALMGPLFKRYGSWVIMHYQKQYLENFILPNSIHYYAPPAEFLEYYNDQRDSVSEIAKSWFRYPSNKVFTRISDRKAYLLDIYPILTGVSNVVLFLSLIFFFFLRVYNHYDKLSKVLLLVTFTWILNAVFTIASSPAAIRLQAFPIILETAFAILLVQWLFELGFETQIKEKESEKISIETIRNEKQSLA